MMLISELDLERVDYLSRNLDSSLLQAYRIVAQILRRIIM